MGPRMNTARPGKTFMHRGRIGFPPLGQRDYIFDATGFAEQQLPVLIDLIAAGNERTEGAGPAFQEYPKVPNRSLERLAVGIDCADDGLVLQHEIAHDDVGVDPDGWPGRGDP